MKYILGFVFCALMFVSCEGDDDGRNNNPFLVDTSFNIQLSSIQALDLQVPGTAIFNQNGGIRGVIVINTGSGFLAWEASDPNHAPNECSRMEVVGGFSARCQCDDDNTYNLITGQSIDEVLEFTMLPYRVNVNGSVITVSN